MDFIDKILEEAVYIKNIYTKNSKPFIKKGEISILFDKDGYHGMEFLNDDNKLIFIEPNYNIQINKDK